MEIKVKTIENDEEYLRQISEDVDFSDKSYLGDIEKLEEFILPQDTYYALAAIQIGIPKRIIYVKNTDLDEDKLKDKNYNEARVLINPKIISRKGKTKYWEACGSCLNYTGLVERPYEIQIEYYDENGVEHNEIFEGFEATVLSHEYDHLDGILHIDIAEEILSMSREERTEFRKMHPYEIISKTCDYDNNFTKKLRK